MWQLDCEESWVLKNWYYWTVVLAKTLESPLDCKEIQPVHSKGDQSWVFFGKNDAKASTSTLATSCEELTHWKRLWCWEGLGEGGRGEDRGWDGWMASPTGWIWVWGNCESWWCTGRLGVLQFMGLQIQIQLSDWTDWWLLLPYNGGVQYLRQTPFTWVFILKGVLKPGLGYLITIRMMCSKILVA